MRICLRKRALANSLTIDSSKPVENGTQGKMRLICFAKVVDLKYVSTSLVVWASSLTSKQHC